MDGLPQVKGRRWFRVCTSDLARTGESMVVSHAKTLIRNLIRSRRRAAGAGLVEFALASLLFLPITLGTVDLGRAIFEMSQLRNGVREGARYGKTCTNGNPPSPRSTSDIRTRVETYSTGFTLSSFSASYAGTPCVPDTSLTVQAGTTFTPIIAGFLNATLGGSIPGSFTLSASATVRIE
jgi:hypothetical protein